MNQFLSEIYEKYTKMVKSANLIGLTMALPRPLLLLLEPGLFNNTH